MKPHSAHAERTEDELAHFFSQSLDLLCVAGLDGYFMLLNPAWTTRLGWTQEQLLRKPFLDLVHSDDRKATLAQLDRLVEGEKAALFENRYRHRDGSYRWLRWNARSVPERRRIYAIARDVTALKLLEREVLEIADQEKERLGSELHDGLCQSLAGIAALSTTLSRRLAASSADPAASAAAAEITTLLNETITQARDLARGLGPLGLDKAGLDRALEALALSVKHRFGVSCTFACDLPFLRSHREIEAHLYRIAQEAVNNAVRHGRADRIEISLSSKDGKGLLSVRDNGVGLLEEGDGLDGIGRHTMAYRAHLIGGSMEVRRRARRGTTAICSFPLPEIPDKREEPDHAHDNA